MNYKDLIFKITSNNKLKKTSDDTINPIKKELQSKDILIGFMSDSEIELTKEMLEMLKVSVERTLTVLLHSPLSDSFGFLPFDQKILDVVVDTFPEKRIHYISDTTDNDDEYQELKTKKETKLNITNVYKSKDKLKDFINKIDYLVTVNTELEPSLKAKLEDLNIMVFPIDLQEIQTSAQKEKLVKPDGSGWVYNSANGMWVKTWGWDGKQELKGW